MKESWCQVHRICHGGYRRVRPGSAAVHQVTTVIKLGAEAKMVFTPRDVVQGIYRSVAVAVARGNAHIIERNLRLCEAQNA